MAKSVFLYWPNLIGYARIIFAFMAFYVAYDDWKMFFVYYATSQLLDAFDGMAARAFDECSRVGAVLDMVTDRFSTNVLCAILAHFYPQYSFPLYSFMVLDFVAHWVQMYSSLVCGEDSHKKANISNPLLRLYYTNRIVLFLVCACQEGFFCGMYLLNFVPKGSDEWKFAYYVCILGCAPLTIFKQFTNVLQLVDSFVAINDWETKQKQGKKK